jgi:hypothetical protein
MKKLMFALIGTILLVAPKDISAQETIILPEVVVSASCLYVEVTIAGVSGTLEICEICVEGNCHTEYDVFF